MLGLAHKITKTPKFSFHQKTSKIQKLKFRFKIDLTRLLMSFSLFQIRSKKRKYKKTNKVVKNVVSQFPLKCLNHPFCDFCPLFITHQQVCKSVRVGLNLNELQKKKKNAMINLLASFQTLQNMHIYYLQVCQKMCLRLSKF